VTAAVEAGGMGCVLVGGGGTLYTSSHKSQKHPGSSEQNFEFHQGPPCGGSVGATSAWHSWGPHAAPCPAACACVQHVDGLTGREREKKESGWRSEQQERLQMLLVTPSSRSEEQRQKTANKPQGPSKRSPPQQLSQSGG
jgi:hypothetical protein